MVVLDREAIRDVFDYVGLVYFIEALFPVSVDVASRDALKPHIRLRGRDEMPFMRSERVRDAIIRHHRQYQRALSTSRLE